MRTNTHKIVIVGGGAGGLELATHLGKAFGRGTQAHITLGDKNRTPISKPKLHEIASCSTDVGDHEVGDMAQAHWNHFIFGIGELKGLNCETKTIDLAAELYRTPRAAPMSLRWATVRPAPVVTPQAAHQQASHRFQQNKRRRNSVFLNLG